MEAATPDTAEAALVESALSLRIDDLPGEVRRHLKAIVLDNVGIAVGAAARGMESGRICEDYVLTLGGAAEASLWSGGGRVPASAAALANGTWAEILDFQDVVVDGRNNGHAAAAMIPAALAAAESVGAGGADLMTALAGGLEVHMAVLRAIGRKHREDGRGFRTTAILAPLGSAVACARLFGLTPVQALDAMGLAGACQSSGLLVALAPSNDSFRMDKDLVNGVTAEGAVRAARLAAAGMTGSHQIVTGEAGMIDSYAAGDGWPAVTPEPGQFNTTRVALKKYPACYGCHAAAEAALRLRAEHDLKDSSAISGVVVRVKQAAAETLNVYTIRNHMAARFSLPYCVAVALVHGRLTLEDFEPDALADDRVLALLPRIAVESDDHFTRLYYELGAYGGGVDVTAGGRSFSKRLDHPPGSAENPMSRADLLDKFAALTAERWDDAHRGQIVEAIDNLEDLADVRELTNLIAAHAGINAIRETAP